MVIREVSKWGWVELLSPELSVSRGTAGTGLGPLGVLEVEEIGVEREDGLSSCR